jgi:hypothetical protein
MDNFNLRNMQLAYTAVYDQNLCESMEELGLIGEGSSGQGQFELWVNELLNEGYDLSDYTWDELGELYEESDSTAKGKAATKRIPVSKMKPADAEKHIAATLRANRKRLFQNLHQNVKEDYDAFDIVLEYLLDEGFAETVEGAEAIMVNMSEGWIETILEAREPGVKPYRANPTMAEINAGRKKKKSDSESGYGEDKKFYKPEDSSIPNKEWLEKAAAEKKKFGRPIGKYDPAQIKRGDIERKFPENSPGAKPRRVLPDPDRSNRAPKPRVLPNPKR